MGYQIFWGAGSPHSWRVLLACEIMRLKYQSNLLEFSKNEHKSEEMLAMNPRGRLPVLKNGDESIYESIAILVYLDGKHPKSLLFGNTVHQKSIVWQRIFECENYLNGEIYNVILPIYSDEVADNVTAIEKATDIIHMEFQILEKLFEANPYLAGDRITAADITLFPAVVSLRRAVTLKAAATLNLDFNKLESNYPRLADWIKRIEAIPGYQNTYPPNWHD